MKFTGTNILYLPRSLQVNYYVRNISLDSTGRYLISSRQFSNTTSTGTDVLLFALSGTKIVDNSGRFLATYNTGEAFDVSGWHDALDGYKYLAIGDILSRTPTLTGSGYWGAISIACPSGASLSCDLLLNATRPSCSLSFIDMRFDGVTYGTLSSTIPMYINNDSLRFYQSYENQLSGTPLLAYVDASYPISLTYYENDTAYTDDTIQFDYSFGTPYKQDTFSFNISRTGIYDSGVYYLSSNSNASGFSGLFNGFWSGSGFFYSDSVNSLSASTSVAVVDMWGNLYPKNITYGVTLYQSGAMLQANCITGFRLTASGEYLYPPQVSISGYYYTTGIQQALNTLLFSSGCTGNLNVLFSGRGGTGASGYLEMNTVYFSGVYGAGVRQFRVPARFVTTHVGTGYLIAPKAFVNTGQYGAACYDVPKTSGYNYGWYRPFDTSGTADIEAGWATGVALYKTGLVSGGLMTGIIVTGIDMYNIGTGYSSGLRPPLMSFIRTGETGLTLNASGVFLMKTGSALNTSNWRISVGSAGQTLTNTGFNGSYTMSTDAQTFLVQLNCSGIDITETISGNINVGIFGAGLSTSYLFTYQKYYDTSPTALKKKLNELTVFPVEENLSFVLSQSELDTLYSDANYTNNTWPYVEGDFDF